MIGSHPCFCIRDEIVYELISLTCPFLGCASGSINSSPVEIIPILGASNTGILVIPRASNPPMSWGRIV